MIKFGKNLAEKLELLSSFPVLLNPKLGRRLSTGRYFGSLNFS